jgi:hypothetical protein
MTSILGLAPSKKGGDPEKRASGDIANDGENTSPRPLFGSLHLLAMLLSQSFAFSQEY